MLAQLALFSLAAFAPLVAAHGSMKAVWIDGKHYPAPMPQEDAAQYTIRSINDINPVKGTNNPDLNCGHNAQKAGLVADAAPGSKLDFSWRNGEGGDWVHNTGPVLTYLAPCGANGCTTFDSANAQFFKISELGKHADGNGWFMGDLTTGPDATTSVTLPTNLPAGEYLVRHELIAMQLGMSPGGAEFYPACMQIRLSAPSRTAASLPSGKEVVTFPGGYSDSDPGILDPNIYNPGNVYTFPGPAIAAIATGGDIPASGSISSSATPTIAASSSSNTSAPLPTSTGGGCGGRSQKKKRVIKRIVQQGPLIKRHVNKTIHRREVPSKPELKRTAAPAPSAAAQERTFAVRSRVMRGI